MLVLEEDLDQKIQLSYTLAPIFTFAFSKYADGKHENQDFYPTIPDF